VGDEKDCHALLVCELAEKIENIRPRGGVEHADNLIRDQKLYIHEQGARDEQALELPAGELVRVLPQDFPRVQVHHADHLLYPALELRPIMIKQKILVYHPERAVDFIERIEGRKGILKDTLNLAVIAAKLVPPQASYIPSLVFDRSGAGPEESQDQFAQRRLPRTRLPDDRNKTAR